MKEELTSIEEQNSRIIFDFNKMLQGGKMKLIDCYRWLDKKREEKESRFEKEHGFHMDMGFSYLYPEMICMPDTFDEWRSELKKFQPFSKTLEFPSKSRLTEKSCDRLCNRLNADLKKHKEDKDNFLAAVEEAKQRLAVGEKLEDVFDYCSVFQEGFACVALNDKCNYIDSNGNILSDEWKMEFYQPRR
jgi:hypothetical protein